MISMYTYIQRLSKFSSTDNWKPCRNFYETEIITTACLKIIHMQGLLKKWKKALNCFVTAASLADLWEWPRSHATFNWPIKSISFPRFAVHRTWTRSRFSFRTVLLLTTIQLNISVTLIWMIKYVWYLIIAWIITSHLESFYRHN